MGMNGSIFTSESVTEGHPDKLCDQISDAVLDAALKVRKDARVACECFATDGLVVIGGECSFPIDDVEGIARKVIADIGYTDESIGMDAKTVKILNKMHYQSSDISGGVFNSYEMREKLVGNDDDSRFDKQGAGDQGMMFGYACMDTETCIPMPIYLAHKLTKKLSDVRKSGEVDWLRPDGKAQVTVEYDSFDMPVRCSNIVLSTQHKPDVTEKDLREAMMELVIRRVVPETLIDEDTEIYINPAGRFVLGGPAADTGLTGRKIIVDTYGGYAPVGGGCFSGKDASKVDRSGAYMARYAAKNIVSAGLADRCLVKLAYAIGVAKPVAVDVEAFGTSKYTDEKLREIMLGCFDFRPLAITEKLGLTEPIFQQTAAYGHFGRKDILFPWEGYCQDCNYYL